MKYYFFVNQKSIVWKQAQQAGSVVDAAEIGEVENPREAESGLVD
jgi:hypothetical protein